MVGWTLEDLETWGWYREIEWSRHSSRKIAHNWGWFHQVKCSCLDAQHDGQGLENPHLCGWNLKKRNGLHITFQMDLRDFIELCVDNSLAAVKSVLLTYLTVTFLLCSWEFGLILGSKHLDEPFFPLCVFPTVECFVRIGCNMSVLAELCPQVSLPRSLYTFPHCHLKSHILDIIPSLSVPA